MIYSTFIGGNSNDRGYGIALDGNGFIYVTGWTLSSNYDVTTGGFQTTNEGKNDVFVTKLNQSGTNLVYSSYIGGSDDDEAYSIAIDGSGFAYITGRTFSTNYDITTGGFQTTKDGHYDVFVTKLNQLGTGLVYSTYIGGYGVDEAYGIKTDSNGFAYVTGVTSSSDYDITSGVFQQTYGGGNDVFVTKLNQTGSGLVYSTYIGGGGSDYGYGIAVDGNGFVYITGETGSPDFDVTPGAFQTTSPGYDVFVMKLNQTGTGLIYSTYIGGIGFDIGNDIAIDSGGFAYVTGYTYSMDYDVTPGAFQTSRAGPTDVFVTKLNQNGTGLIYSTYIGGNADEIGYGIAIGGSGFVYITGSTCSFDYDVTLSVFQPTNGGGGGTPWDVFVTKLCPETSPTLSLISPTVISQTVCVNNTLLPVTFSAAGSSTASFSGLPSGVVGSYNAGSVSITGTPTVTGNYIYTVNISGPSCSGTITTGTINVLQGPQAGTINTSGSPVQSVCINHSILPITFSVSGASGATVYGLPQGVNHTVYITSGLIQIAGTPTQTGLYQYSVNLTGPQCNKTFTGSISVGPPVSFGLLTAPSATYQNPCINTTIQPLSYTVTGVSAVTFSGLPSGVSGSHSGNTVTISGTPSLSGYYSYSVFLNGACGNGTVQGILNVIPLPTLGITSGSLFQNVCTGSSVQSISFSTTPLASVNVTGLPNGLNFYFYTNGGIISGTPNVSPGSYPYTVTVQNTCGITTQTGTFVVNSGNASATHISGTETQTVCEGDSITPIAYSVSGVSSISVSGLPSGIGYSLAPGLCVIEGIALNAGYYPYQLTVQGCGNNNAVKQGTINVLPSISMVLTGSHSTQSQTLCLGKALEEIEYVVSGNFLNTIQVTGLPSGVEYDFDSSDQEVKIEGTPTSAGIYTYVLTSPGVCLKGGEGVIKVDECTNLQIPTGVSGNGIWFIENIEQYPDNEVFIFGRWGNKIAVIKGYNNKDKAWGSGQYPINVPEGTYYYVISVRNIKYKGYVEVLK